MNVSLPHCLKMLNVRFPHFLLSALNEAASLWAKKLKKCFKKKQRKYLHIWKLFCIFVVSLRVMAEAGESIGFRRRKRSFQGPKT